MGRASALPGWGTHSNPAGVRVSNQIEYRSPSNESGLFVHGSHILGENVTNTVNKDDGTGDSLRFGYNKGPLLLAASYGKVQYAKTATSGDAKYSSAAFTYQIGITKLTGLVTRETFDTTTPYDIKGQLLGGTTMLNDYEIRYAYSTSERVNTTVPANPKISKLAFGVGYKLDKNFTIYANLASLKNSGGSSAALGGALTAANESSRAMDLGVRYTF